MIEIKSKDLSNIIAHCKTEDPIEACGILAGKISDLPDIIAKQVEKVYSCKNELNSTFEYSISPEEQFQIFRDMSTVGLDLLGFYHSHTYTVSRPSAIDRERANYLGYSYMIVALHPVKVSSWVLEKQGTFTEEKIKIL
jgi:proteasome lid subunit RPN8/RPN11